jgi:hypothetical protein
MADSFAVAIMTETITNGVMDLKLIIIDADNRHEAVGRGFDRFQDDGIIVHKVTSIRIGTSDGSFASGADQVYLDFLAEGKKIHAIKQYRADTGHGLRESKAYIDNLESKHNIQRDRQVPYN